MNINEILAKYGDMEIKDLFYIDEDIDVAGDAIEELNALIQQVERNRYWAKGLDTLYVIHEDDFSRNSFTIVYDRKAIEDCNTIEEAYNKILEIIE